MSGKIKEGLNMFLVLLRCSVIVSRRFQLSVVKPKPNQLRTSETTRPILKHSKTKAKVTA